MLLEARDVTRTFGSFKAVDAASVTLEQGDILGLIGPNGAGKSTLFNCLTGDLQATSGKVLFEGHDITHLTPEARAHLGLARTFQVPQTFEGMSVLENVMIGAFLRTPHRAEAETRIAAFRALGNRAGTAVAEMLSFSEGFDLRKYGWDGAPLHDPTVIAYLLAPGLFSGRACNVAIETVSELTRGMTVADYWHVTDRPHNATFVRSGDADGFYQLLTERLARLP